MPCILALALLWGTGAQAPCFACGGRSNTWCKRQLKRCWQVIYVLLVALVVSAIYRTTSKMDFVFSIWGLLTGMLVLWFFFGIGAMEAIRGRARVAEKSPLAAGFSSTAERFLMENMFERSGAGRWMPPEQLATLVSAARDEAKKAQAAKEKYELYCETSKKVLEFFMEKAEEKKRNNKDSKKKEEEEAAAAADCAATDGANDVADERTADEDSVAASMMHRLSPQLFCTASELGEDAPGPTREPSRIKIELDDAAAAALGYDTTQPPPSEAPPQAGLARRPRWSISIEVEDEEILRT